ncbi:MAG TPA: cupin domain-containing protein [Blastocatellia bacterium]|nr:cupin domain-containing protein [Blastocatellia bacterium]
MKRRLTLIITASLMLASLVLAQSDKMKKGGHSDMQGSGSHVLLDSNEVKWGPGPPSLPPGAQLAVVEGDPTKAGGTFTVRAKLPDGYKIPPHWHPTTENVTVLEGTFYMGMGDKFDEAAARELKPGSFASMSKGTRHYAWSKGETVIQVHGVGPFEVTYVNPADDPRKK